MAFLGVPAPQLRWLTEMEWDSVSWRETRATTTKRTDSFAVSVTFRRDSVTSKGLKPDDKTAGRLVRDTLNAL
jgi:hypothetical protein